MSTEQLEFKIGEDESPAEVEINEEKDASERIPENVQVAPEEQPQPQAGAKPAEDELDQYSENVQKRISKLTARLRETQRREEAALEYAKNVQAQLQAAQKQVIQTNGDRLMEAKSRIETQSVALKQIIKKAREEGDVDTEMEANERLAALVMEQRQVQQAEAHRAAQAQQPQQPQQYQQPEPQQRQKPALDPKAEEWASKNDWYGVDPVMTMTVRGIHIDLVQNQGVDPTSDEYYDEIDRRMRETFPNKFQQSSQNSRTPRPAQAVAPANRSSGVNNARRTVRLTPSQVAIAKKLGVPLEEYAKYVKE